MNNLSIVIPDYKSKFLKKTILSALKLNPNKIVVANYLTDFTKKIQSEITDTKVHFLNFNERMYPGGYRNAGADKCNTENILFLDSDVELKDATKNFIESKLRNLKPDSIIWGVYTDYNNLSFLQNIQLKILKYRFSKDFYNKSTSQQKVYCGQSSHFIISKDLFVKIGGFNPYLRMREDNDFCIRAKILGAKNILDEDFEVIHLKNFEIFNDYFTKPHLASKVKVEEPIIFNQANPQIGVKLFFHWLLPFPFFLSLIFVSKSVLLFFIITYFFFIYITIPKKLKNLFSFGEALFYVPLSMAIGLLFTFGGITGAFNGFFCKIKNFAKSGIDYLKIIYKILSKNGKPIQIVNFITARCNLRCNHCFYKDTLDAPDPGEMNIEIINNYTKKIGSVLWYALGGGEPFLRKDIPKLFETVKKNCNPKIFTIPTNGWYVEKIYLSTLRMLQFSKNNNNIIIQFSIDGNQEMHDQIRGKNSYSKVKEAMERLKPLQEIYQNLNFSIITVVNNENSHIYPEFIDQLIKLGTNSLNINLFRYSEYEHPKIPDKTVDRYKLAVERYEKFLKEKKLKSYNFIGAKLMRLKEALQKDLIYEVAKYNRFVTPCTAGTLSYVIWEDGRVNPCEILKDTIGNVNKNKIDENLFSSKIAKNLRKRIKETNCKCTYECAMSTNTFFSWNMTKKMIKAYFANRV